MPVEKIVYIVDDDAGVRRSLERLLDSAGLRALSYESPLAFLDAAVGLSAGCVLLDVRMPEMDGLTLQVWLAKLEVALPVIVITGQGDVQTAVRAMKAGAVDFIEKPYNDESLLNAIETALARAGRPDRAHEAGEAKHRIAELTPRERQVLDALVRTHDGTAASAPTRRGNTSFGDGGVGEVVGVEHSKRGALAIHSATPGHRLAGFHQERACFPHCGNY